MIVAREISRQIAGRNIPDRVSVEIAPGSVTAIIGPNGAGKSTLLKCLTGTFLPDAGDVLLDGRPLAQFALSELARRRAVLSQGISVAFPFLVSEIVAMGRAPHRGSAGSDAAAIRQSLESVDAWNLRDRIFPTLSGGERQRVQLARVLAQIWGQSGAYLFLDEPTSELDLKHQHLILTLVRELSRSHGIGVCLVMHDLGLVRRYSDQVIIVCGGRSIAAGPVSDVVTPDNISAVFEVPPGLVFGDHSWNGGEITS